LFKIDVFEALNGERGLKSKPSRMFLSINIVGACAAPNEADGFCIHPQRILHGGMRWLGS